MSAPPVPPAAESTPLRVLVVDDSPDDTLLLIEHLRAGGYAPLWRRVASEDALRTALDDEWDIVLADYTMPGFSGSRALALVLERAPQLPFIFVSGTLGEDAAVQALKDGAADYVTKRDLRRLLPAIARERQAARSRHAQASAAARSRHLLAVSPDAVIGFDSAQRIVLWSDGAQDLLGHTPQEAIGRPLDLVIPAPHRDTFDQALAAFRDSEASAWRLAERIEVEALGRHGARVPVEAGLSRYHEDGVPIFVLVLRDITERRLGEREMRLLLMIAEIANESRTLRDTVRACVQSVCRVLGWPRVQLWRVQGDERLVCEAAHTHDGPSDEPQAPLVAADELPIRAWRTRDAQWLSLDAGADLPARLATLRAQGRAAAIAVPVLGEDGVLAVLECFLDQPQAPDPRVLQILQAVAAQFGNALRRKLAERRLHRLAHYDALTDLPNRVLFVDRLERALAEAARHGGTLGLIFVDLDRFKHVNDSLGHHIGDHLLRGLAERLRAAVRDEDTVARLAGDEFGVLVPNLARAEDLARVARKLLETLDAPVDLDGHPVRSSASLGLALYPNDGGSAEDLLRNADSAMYRAKSQGGGTFCFFEPGMTMLATDRLALEADLGRAIRGGELTVRYQPIRSVASGATIGVEALVRWRHPQRGLLPPEQFLPLAEDSGLIHTLGDWVLRRACADIGALPLDAGFTLAVNVSPGQIAHPEFAARVTQALADTGFDPHRLQFEVTEAALRAGGESAIDTLGRLHQQAGIRFSIDDFGAGYSNIARLHQLAVSKLKIAPTLLAGATTQRDAATLVSALVALGHSLGMQVVAEGVESAEHADLLGACGCNELQGFAISEPLSVDALQRWLGAGR
jgi:diguanylate cyclase (GGDEF)-like protein/PAS domain S-box-containing protein